MGLATACRMQSIEYVGKAGKSLSAYTDTMGNSATLCEIQKGEEVCRTEAVYDSDELVARSLSMLAEYGAGLEKLSGKKSVGLDKLVEGGLTLNAATEWTDLGDKGPDAIKKGAGLIDKLIAGGIQRKVFKETYTQLGDTMAELEARYKTVLVTQLEYICRIDHQIREQRALFGTADIACPEGSNATCENQLKLILMSSESILIDLRRRRQAVYEAGAGVALFFAAHETLGQLVRSNGKSDKEVAAAMKAAGKEAKANMKKYLEEAESSISDCQR
ncbi:MAG: hypothetical protein R6X02_24635 [Enhygromyxa sp.]